MMTPAQANNQKYRLIIQLSSRKRKQFKTKIRVKRDFVPNFQPVRCLPVRQVRRAGCFIR